MTIKEMLNEMIKDKYWITILYWPETNEWQADACREEPFKPSWFVTSNPRGSKATAIKRMYKEYTKANHHEQNARNKPL